MSNWAKCSSIWRLRSRSKAQETPDRFTVALGTIGVQRPALAEHGLFDLGRNHGPDLAQVLADLLNLLSRAHEELEVGGQVLGTPPTLCRLLIAGGHEVVDLDVVLLAMAIDPAGGAARAGSGSTGSRRGSNGGSGSADRCLPSNT